MPTLLNPYLHFDGTARDAITFYQSVFGGELSLNTFGETLTPGSTVTLRLSGDDDATLRGWFDALSAGGVVHVPLEKQMWGDIFGQLADKYGVTWMVNINQAA